MNKQLRLLLSLFNEAFFEDFVEEIAEGIFELISLSFEGDMTWM